MINRVMTWYKPILISQLDLSIAINVMMKTVNQVMMAPHSFKDIFIGFIVMAAILSVIGVLNGSYYDLK